MVEKVDVKVDWDPSNNGYADIIILEDCGMSSLELLMGQEIILTHSQIHQDVQEMLCLHIHLLIQTHLLAVPNTFRFSSGGSDWQYCSSSYCPLPGGYTYEFKVTDSYGDGWDGYLQ